mmetsp:Transcript_29591/g.70388  ORF Transcript_29591/g.70388 Transcript_29591/m.70388 type:complete len:220 (-) Transcript_29591:609-1268(-)
MSFLFGKAPDPKEQCKKWRLQLKREMRDLDRQITGIDREEKKVKAEAKKAAKDGQLESAKFLAKQIVQSRKAKERILCTKANINSMEMQLGNQQAMLRVAGALEKSSELMSMMNDLIKIPEIAGSMREMAQEMEKANLIDEMMQEAFDDMEPESLQEESDLEVQKVLDELTGTQVGAMKVAPTAVPVRPQAEEAPAAEEEEGDVDLSEMQARIAALRAA